MTTTAEKIAVMQAFERGEPVEIRTTLPRCEWGEANAPSWDWRAFDYRVKPKPARYTIALDVKGKPWGASLEGGPVMIHGNIDTRSIRFITVEEVKP